MIVFRFKARNELHLSTVFMVSFVNQPLFFLRVNLLVLVMVFVTRETNKSWKKHAKTIWNTPGRIQND